MNQTNFIFMNHFIKIFKQNKKTQIFCLNLPILIQLHQNPFKAKSVFLTVNHKKNKFKTLLPFQMFCLKLSKWLQNNTNYQNFQFLILIITTMFWMEEKLKKKFHHLLIIRNKLCFLINNKNCFMSYLLLLYILWFFKNNLWALKRKLNAS